MVKFTQLYTLCDRYRLIKEKSASKFIVQTQQRVLAIGGETATLTSLRLGSSVNNIRLAKTAL